MISLIKRILASVTVACCCLPMLAQQNIEWVEFSHNFGAIEENDGNASCEFRFVNKGDKPVAIVSASASCGCTTPVYSPRPVEPGDTGFVSIEFNPAGRPGRFDKKVRIETTDGESQSFRSTLRIKGVVVGNSVTVSTRYPCEAGAKARMRTSTLAFGELERNRRKSCSIEVYNISRDTIEPSWINMPEYINVRCFGTRIGPGEQKTYTFFFDGLSSPDYGIVTDTLLFIADPGEDSIAVESIANVKEDFSKLTPKQRANAPVISINPEIVDFGEIDRDGGLVTRTFEISNRGVDPLIIRRLYTPDRGVTVAIDKDKIKKNKRAVVTITVDPSQLPSEILSARLTVINNDPALATTVVRISGLVK